MKQAQTDLRWRMGHFQGSALSPEAEAQYEQELKQLEKEIKSMNLQAKQLLRSVRKKIN
jgi:hypothetical protein